MVVRVRPSSSNGISNTFLRKRRKWPHSPYKTKWHFIFNQQQALQTLIKSSSSSSPDSVHQETPQNPAKTPSFLLNCLINSFNSYSCNPTPNAYDFIIKTLIQKSQFSELDYVLSHLQKVETFDTPEYIFVNLIRVYGEKGMFKEAIDLFFRIPHFRCAPTVYSLNSLLLILCRNRELLRIVPQLMLKSRVMNIRIEGSCFSILVNALCRIGKVDYAIKLLNYMIDDEFNPDGKLFSLILSSLCKQKGGVNMTSFDVVGIFEDMKRVGFCPARDDFRNVINFLGKEGKGKDAFDVLCEMKREGIKPDIVCYRLVLYGLVEEGELSRAEELFDEILLFGLVPDVRTFNVFLNGLCKQKKANAAYKMIGCMEELGCPPDSATYTIVLEGFYEVGDLNRAREVCSEMKLKGLVSNPQAYGITVDSFVGLVEKG